MFSYRCRRRRKGPNWPPTKRETNQKIKRPFLLCLLAAANPFEVGGNSADVRGVIDEAPKWVPIGKSIGAYLENPEDTLEAMHKENTFYIENAFSMPHTWHVRRPCTKKAGCLQMINQGMPIPFYDHFTAACKGKPFFTKNRLCDDASTCRLSGNLVYRMK